MLPCGRLPARYLRLMLELFCSISSTVLCRAIRYFVRSTIAPIWHASALPGSLCPIGAAIPWLTSFVAHFLFCPRSTQPQEKQNRHFVFYSPAAATQHSFLLLDLARSMLNIRHRSSLAGASDGVPSFQRPMGGSARTGSMPGLGGVSVLRTSID